MQTIAVNSQQNRNQRKQCLIYKMVRLPAGNKIGTPGISASESFGEDSGQCSNQTMAESRISEISMSTDEIIHSLATSIEDPSEKAVSFADDSSGSISVANSNHGQQELLLKCASLVERLKSSEIDLSAERAIRKKKERSLMKLARELKKRNGEREEGCQRLEEVSILPFVCLRCMPDYLNTLL